MLIPWQYLGGFMNQTTIQKSVYCSGIGLHSGKVIRLGLHPAYENTGIVFQVNLPNSPKGELPKRLSLEPAAVITTELATTLGELDADGNPKAGVSVSTIEHLLAAVRALRIDNLIAEVDGFEVPVLDGSAAPYLRLFKEAGIEEQQATRHALRISRTVQIEDGNKSIIARPHDGFFVDYSIDFPHPAIGKQRLALEITPKTFSAIANARTFGFLAQVEAMRERGLALGGSLENAVVLDNSGVVNPEGLRCPDEFVRHKMLDFVGDMAMLGLPLEGHFTVNCSGHGLNNQFLRMLTQKKSNMLSKISYTREVAAPREKESQKRIEYSYASACTM